MLVREVTEKLLQSLVEGNDLPELTMYVEDLSWVQPELLTSVITMSLETVTLKGGDLTTLQIESILTSIRDADIKLKSLHLRCNDLSEIDPNLMAEAVSKLETVSIVLTKEQAETVLTAVRDNDTRLKCLHLESTDLSRVDANLMASALSKLETAYINDTELTKKQAETVLAVFRDGNPQIKVLHMEDSDLSDVNPDLLGEAVAKLDTLEICGCDLTTEQAETILFSIRNGENKLKSLDLGGNDLAEVNPDLMAGAVSKLETVGLNCIKMTTAQAKAIFYSINKNSKLKNLHIYNDLTELEADLIALTGIKLESLYLGSDNVMTSEQTNTLLRQSLVQTSLKKLEICGFPDLDPDLVAQAEEKYHLDKVC